MHPLLRQVPGQPPPRVDRAAGATPMELFERLLGTPGLIRLTLQGIGEPPLQSRPADMVAAAKARRVEVGLPGNGMR